MLEFSVSNQLLSRLDATEVVGGSRNYLECEFQFSEDWEGLKKVAMFGHGKEAEPIGVELEDGKCRVPHEVIQPYGFQLAVYGSGGEEGRYTHVPTNVVTVEVAKSGADEELEVEPSQSLYDSVMAKLSAVEDSTNQAKVSAAANAQTATEAAAGAKAAENSAQAAKTQAEEKAQAAERFAQEAKESREEIGQAEEICAARKEETTKLVLRARSFALGLTEERDDLLYQEPLDFSQGDITDFYFVLEPERRYLAKVGIRYYEGWSRLVEASGSLEHWCDGTEILDTEIQSEASVESQSVLEGKYVVELEIAGVKLTYTLKEGELDEGEEAEECVISGSGKIASFTLYTDGEDNARGFCEMTREYKDLAKAYASTATNQRWLAQSWAVGGTGKRTAEDTNNAKYFVEKAAETVAEHAADGTVHVTAEEKEKWNGLEERVRALEGRSA